MRLTILGNCGPYPRSGGACSGYLLEEEGFKILIDCGNGILSRLLSITPLKEIDCIILSHLHSDHMSDIMVMRYAIALNKKDTVEKSIPLYAPISPKEIYDSIQFNKAFILNPLTESTVLNFGKMEFKFKLMEHSIETYGIIIKNEDKKFVYSSDTKLCDSIIEISKDADLLLCECNLLQADLNDEIYHLSAKQVGSLARNCRVKRVLLTHLWPEYSYDEILREVKEEFNGEVEIAKELYSYEL